MLAHVVVLQPQPLQRQPRRRERRRERLGPFLPTPLRSRPRATTPQRRRVPARWAAPSSFALFPRSQSRRSVRLCANPAAKCLTPRLEIPQCCRPSSVRPRWVVRRGRGRGAGVADRVRLQREQLELRVLAHRRRQVRHPLRADVVVAQRELEHAGAPVGHATREGALAHPLERHHALGALPPPQRHQVDLALLARREAVRALSLGAGAPRRRLERPRRRRRVLGPLDPLLVELRLRDEGAVDRPLVAVRLRPSPSRLRKLRCDMPSDRWLRLRRHLGGGGGNSSAFCDSARVNILISSSSRLRSSSAATRRPSPPPRAASRAAPPCCAAHSRASRAPSPSPPRACCSLRFASRWSSLSISDCCAVSSMPAKGMAVAAVLPNFQILSRFTSQQLALPPTLHSPRTRLRIRDDAVFAVAALSVSVGRSPAVRPRHRRVHAKITGAALAAAFAAKDDAEPAGRSASRPGGAEWCWRCAPGSTLA